MRFQARLDDLRPDRRRSAAFTDQVGEIVATDPAHVRTALDQVEAAARRGLWAVGYVAYEAAPAFDSNLEVLPRGEFHSGLPLVWFGLFARRLLNPEPRVERGEYQLSGWEWIDDRDHFVGDVATIRDHIVAGDTYQVNYTTRLRARFSGDPVSLYEDLSAAQSGGYGTYLDTGRFQVVSASPELFFDRYPTGRGTDRLITRPMKGTVARGRWEAEDVSQRQWLAGSLKNRAENLIVVDLLRNDLGRIADFGTVRADDLFTIERYDTVWQMTSTISAEVGSDVPLRDVFGGLFPCGSITGAPKVRTMEIIADLESEPRGVYTGAIGFVSPPDAPGPRASFSVGIRTVVIDGASGEAEYGVGGGITFDSDPGGEYEEAALKAQVLSYGRSDFELLETMRWNPFSGWYWLDQHLDRLERSAGYFGIPIDRQGLRERLDRAVGGENDLRVRLTVDRLGRIKATVDLMISDDPRSVAVAIDHEPVDIASPFLFHKTTRRDVYEERRMRHPHADDVLLTNEAGELTESTIANLAVKLDGHWVTPPISSGCLPGVYRQALLDEGRLIERPILLPELERCEGIALINSVRNVATRIRHRRLRYAPVMFHIALHEPEIAPNTGNLMRLTVNTGSRLHLIEPLGFSLDEARVRRAGLDYREFATVEKYQGWRGFLDEIGDRRIFAFSQHAATVYTDVFFEPDDVLLFGKESTGLPKAILDGDDITAAVRIPIAPKGRSLNLANAAAIGVYEAWRQQGFVVPEKTP